VVEAEVSADDISLSCDYDFPVLHHYAHEIADSDGRLYPGETADLIVTLRNYGTNSSVVSADLSSEDPFIVIHEGSAFFGEIPTGATADNAADPYLVEAAPGAPLGHVADLSLTVHHDGGQVQYSDFSLLIGQFHYLIWDPSPDLSSGPEIASCLSPLGYSGSLSQQLPLHRLDDFQTMFISLGIYDNNYVIGANTPEALSIVDYLGAGGRVYMEGNDVWYYDPLIGGHNFNALFGIFAADDGMGDCGPVNGQPGTFTEGMSFAYIGENSYMDRLMPMGDAFYVFKNGTPVYGNGVAYDAGDYKTVGTSFEFGGLVDGAPPSTKMELAEAIMGFFIDDLTGVDDAASTFAGLVAYPNPFNPKTTLRFELPTAGRTRVDILAPSGRCVRTLVDADLMAGVQQVSWDGRDDAGKRLSSGIYLVHVDALGFSASQKLVLLK